MSDADDVLAYFTEFKAGDQVRIVKQQPNGSWPTLDSLGRFSAAPQLTASGWSNILTAAKGS